MTKPAEDRLALLKVIFATDFLRDSETGQPTPLCPDIGVKFVPTSPGFGYVQQPSGDCSRLAAKEPVIRIMPEEMQDPCGVKASAGIKTLDNALRFIYLRST